MKSSLKLLAACIVFSVSVSLRCQQPADLSKLDMTTLEDRASQGDSAAQTELGDRYNNGKGVPHDLANPLNGIVGALNKVTSQLNSSSS